MDFSIGSATVDRASALFCGAECDAIRSRSRETSDAAAYLFPLNSHEFGYGICRFVELALAALEEQVPNSQSHQECHDHRDDESNR